MNSVVHNIIKQITIKENGPVSEMMQKQGLFYKKNHGVSISELKTISEQYQNDSKLAEELRKTGIRECIIISFMIENPQNLSNEKIEGIFEIITNIELAEQVSVQLLNRLSNSLPLAYQWIQSSSAYKKITAYLLISKKAKEYGEENTNIVSKIITYCSKDFNHESYHVRVSLAKALRAIALINNKFRTKVLELTEPLKGTRNSALKIIYQETVELLNY